MTFQPLFPHLTGDNLAVGWAPFDALQGESDPDEWQDIANAAPPRQKEFIAGRQLVRALSESLSLPRHALRRAEDRSPVWPGDRTGGLSHCKTLCAAAVGRHPHYRGVGIDIETIGRVDSKLWPTLFTDSEINYFTSVEPALRDAETTVFFSAKEAFYKCQYPMTQQWVGFQDVELQRVDSATLAIKPAKRDAQLWHQPPIHSSQVDAAHIVTLMLIPA